MESSDTIKVKCMEMISNFRAALKEQFHREISTEDCFVPHFINDDADLNQSAYCLYTRPDYLSTALSAENRLDLDSLVSLIYDNQNKIAWVDFLLLSSSDNDISVYAVELVCLNKVKTEIKFHIACPISNGV